MQEHIKLQQDLKRATFVVGALLMRGSLTQREVEAITLMLDTLSRSIEVIRDMESANDPT